jgi:fibronectin type 3 domain-containing protein
MNDIPKLVALPANLTSPALINEWTNCYASLPPLPTNAGGTYVLPAQTYGASHNSENPECYCIFPYRIYGIGKSNFNIGLATFNNRVVQNNKNCWTQDVIEEPLVGLTGSAQADVISNFSQKDSQCRFPAFWTSHNDYLPDLDNGGAAMTGLQFMLMQCNGNEIRVLPSWPLTWDVDMKFSAPSNTTIRLKFQSGAITQLDASPSFRTNDVILPPPPVAPPSTPTGLTAVPGNVQIALNWSGSGTASSYNVKRSLVNNGTYSNIATNVRSTSYTDTNLINDTRYFYVVSAVNSLGQSANSTQASGIPTATVASASSDNPPNETAAMAFDGSTATKWFNAGGGNTGWLQFYFGGPLKTVVRYDLSSANDVPGRDPKNWQFQGSPNGTTWTTLDARTNETFASRFLTKQYSITNFTAFAYYRLNITANNGDVSGIQLSEMTFTYRVDAPTNLTSTAGDSQVALNWTVSSGATGYNVKRSTVSNGTYATIATSLAALAYTNVNLANGTIYYWVVSATNSFGESANSLETSARPVSKASPQLSFATSTGQIQFFSWPTDHLGWQVQVQTNSPSAGIGTNWVTVPNSNLTNQFSLPIEINSGSVFFRLTYP